MRRLLGNMNPTLRGFLIIALIALVVVMLQLQQSLVAIGMLLRIAFFLAVAFFVYLLWRDRVRGDAENWSTRSRAAFYGGAVLIVAALGILFWTGFGVGGLEAVGLVAILAMSAFAMYRVWRDEHRYGY
jgi:hypothetical protein